VPVLEATTLLTVVVALVVVVEVQSSQWAEVVVVFAAAGDVVVVVEDQSAQVEALATPAEAEVARAATAATVAANFILMDGLVDFWIRKVLRYSS
jgi:hypothetical protein